MMFGKNYSFKKINIEAPHSIFPRVLSHGGRSPSLALACEDILHRRPPNALINYLLRCLGAVVAMPPWVAMEE